MTRRKKTTRRRRPPSSVFHALEAYDDLLGAFDIEDNIHDLERLLGDPLDRVVMAIARPPRPIRARHDQLVVSPLTRSWSIRVGDCGVGVARRERGIDYLVHGAVQDLQVGPRRLAATVQGTRRYRVDVELLLPPQAAMQATRERVQHARAAANGADPRLAIQQAILSGGPGLFPSTAQIHSECTCPDGPRCKHVVAAVWAFGVLLEREPEQLLSLWGLDVKDPLATGVFELPRSPPTSTRWSTTLRSSASISWIRTQRRSRRSSRSNPHRRRPLTLPPNPLPRSHRRQRRSPNPRARRPASSRRFSASIFGSSVSPRASSTPGSEAGCCERRTALAFMSARPR